MTVSVGSAYADPGYAAADNYDGDLTASVVVTGTVDTTQTGTYTIYYDVSDSSGNAAVTQARTIQVAAAPEQPQDGTDPPLDDTCGLPPIVKRYDLDGSCGIDYPEWQRAVEDFANRLLTNEEMWAISKARSY